MVELKLTVKFKFFLTILYLNNSEIFYLPTIRKIYVCLIDYTTVTNVFQRYISRSARSGYH